MIEAVLQPRGDFFNVSRVLDRANNHPELVAAESRQHIVRPKLVLHAASRFLKEDVANAMTVGVIDFFELVEVDVDQSQNLGPRTGTFDGALERSFEGEAIVNVGQQIEFRAMDQDGIESTSFDRDGTQRGSHGECVDRVCLGFI
jgi:hypothetical protein